MLQISRNNEAMSTAGSEYLPLGSKIHILLKDHTIHYSWAILSLRVSNLVPKRSQWLLSQHIP